MSFRKSLFKCFSATTRSRFPTHFLLGNDYTQAIVSDLIPALLSILESALLNILKIFFRETNRGLKGCIEELANHLLLSLDILAAKLWWVLTARFKKQYYDMLYERNYSSIKYGLDPARNPELDKVFVRLRLTSANEFSEEVHSIWDLLAVFSEKPGKSMPISPYLRIVIVGPPGSGKSTLLRDIAITYASNTQRQKHPCAPKFVPILLQLREIQDFIANKQSFTLPEVVTHLQRGENFCQNPAQICRWFEDNLNVGNCLVMLDGLDEVAIGSHYEQVSQWISNQSSKYRKSIFILTSRPFGYDSSCLKADFNTLLAIQPFDREQIKNFIYVWYSQVQMLEDQVKSSGDAEALLNQRTLKKRIKHRNSISRVKATKRAHGLLKALREKPALMEMASNPLLLKLIAIVHKEKGQNLPEKRAGLYKEIFSVQLEKRQIDKGIHDQIQLQLVHKQSILQSMALELMHAGKTCLEAESVVDIVKSYFRKQKIKNISPGELIKYFERVSGLLEKQLTNLPGKSLYQFTHLSFQEYLAAVEIRMLGKEDELLEKIGDPWWKETIRLYAALGNSDHLFEAALKKTDYGSLSLAFDLLEESECKINPKLEEQLIVLQNRGLDSEFPETFRFWAELMLKRRMQKLSKFRGESVWLDQECITCAEYQLFINETAKFNEQHRPAHWQEDVFIYGEGLKPVAGVSFKDAEGFCEWLTKKYSENLFQYRLPKKRELEDDLRELGDNLSKSNDVGAWCIDENDRIRGVVSGIDALYWNEYQKAWKSIFASDCRFTYNLISAIDHQGELNIAFHLSQEKNIELNLNLKSDLDRLKDLDLNLEDGLGLNSDSKLDYLTSFQRVYRENLRSTPERDRHCIVKYRKHIKEKNREISEAEKAYVEAQAEAQKYEKIFREAQAKTRVCHSALHQLKQPISGTDVVSQQHKKSPYFTYPSVSPTINYEILNRGIPISQNNQPSHQNSIIRDQTKINSKNNSNNFLYGRSPYSDKEKTIYGQSVNPHKQPQQQMLNLKTNPTDACSKYHLADADFKQDSFPHNEVQMPTNFAQSAFVQDRHLNINDINDVNSVINDINCPEWRALNAARLSESIAETDKEKALQNKDDCYRRLDEYRKQKQLLEQKLEEANSKGAEHNKAREQILACTDSHMLQRAYLLLISILWGTISRTYNAKANELSQILRPHKRKEFIEKQHKFSEERDKTLWLYTFLLLRDGRRNKIFPAWEGIRIVQEVTQFDAS